MSTGVSIMAMLWVGALSTAGGKSLPVYFGTYSGGQSKGIYRSVFDLETGELSAPVLAAEAKNPSFLEIHPNGKFLYAVSEAGPAGTVSAYAIDAQTGSLKLLNQQPSGGSGPCHVNIDHTGKNALVANYGSGSVSVIPIEPDGRLAKPTGFVQHEGSSINPGRQKEPHAHSVNFSPDNRFAFVADLGIDKIMIYRLDAEKGTIVPNDPPFVKLKPGSGPRHFAFHPNGKFAYVINELACTVTAFAYEPASGALSEIQTIATLPQDFKGSSTCAEVRVHPNGKFLYGSNRGHDSIAVYRVDPAKGTLTLVEFETADIKTPRNFNIDPTGKFCLVANQGSDSVVVFRIDQATGALDPTSHKITVGKPVCIRFLPSGRPDDPTARQDSLSSERRNEICRLISEWCKMGFSVEIRGPLTIAEVEKASLEEISRSPHKDIPYAPFGLMNYEWNQFKSKYKEGDELYYFASDQKSWSAMEGCKGYATIRKNQLIGVIITEVS